MNTNSTLEKNTAGNQTDLVMALAIFLICVGFSIANQIPAVESFMYSILP